MNQDYWKTYGDIAKAEIRKQLELGRKRFAIYPYGQVGVLVKYILNNYFEIHEEYIIDNGQADSKNIFRIQDIQYEKDIYFLICSVNSGSYVQVRRNILEKIPSENIIDLFGNVYEYERINEKKVHEVLAFLEEFSKYE
ncbi:MAG: hypothetical protein HFI96_06360 [Lachnospiraceae bacterium]|nr:hypothetical protein [Lachnospiraceae bacterium]